MFDQLVESSFNVKRQGRWRYFTATAIVWVAALTVAIVGGVVAYDEHLGDSSDITHIGVSQPPPQAGPDSHRAETKQKAANRAVKQEEKLVAHEDSPDKIGEQRSGPPLVPFTIDLSGGPETGHSGSGGSTNVGGEGGLRVTQPPATEPIEPQPEKKREEESQPQLQPVRKSGGVLQGSAIKRVSPMYPPLARLSRTTGAVVVEVVVDESGNVISARALSGHPLLREAAVAAAMQWKWKPTLLSGVPVQVVGTITFNFTL